jgi:hypothetical protein
MPYDSNSPDWNYFTPVHDLILQHYGSRDDREIPTHVLYGLVFGKIFRYCQAYGVCFASQETMSKEIGVGLRTFQRALGDLLEDSLVFVYKRPGTSDVYTLERLSAKEVEKRLKGAQAGLKGRLTVTPDFEVRQSGVGGTPESHTTPDSVAYEQSIKQTNEQSNRAVASVERYEKEFTNKNDEYIKEHLDKRDLPKLKRGIIKEQEKRERTKGKPIKDLDAFMLESVRGGYYKSFLDGYDGAKERAKRKGESEDERVQRFRESAVELEK